MEDSDSDNEAEERLLQARTVYLLMKKDYRISRNIRASWFFHHLNQTLKYSPKTCLRSGIEGIASIKEVKDENDQELTVIAVTPEAEDTSNDELTPLETDDGFNFKLVPSTVLNFIAKRYRLVFVLDFSHSAVSVDLKTGDVLADKIFLTLKRCLSGLVRPFLLPGTNIQFSPELYITVIAHTPVLACTTNQVLMQGIRVDEEKLPSVLDMIQMGLKSFEQNLATEISKAEEVTLNEENDIDLDIQESSQSKGTDQTVNPEAGIINLLRQGYFALQLLPENSSAGIVVVTDGILGVTDVNLYDNIMTQLRNSTIACSFLKIGQTYCARCQFGHVPHVELLQFIATATFGAYISSCPDVSTNMSSYQMNLYHKALLMSSFQKGLEGFKFELTHYRYSEPMHPSALSSRVFAHPIKGRQNIMPVIRKKHMDTKLNTTISSVLSVRLREGYTIKDIYLTKGETQLEVHLVLPWREYVKLEYYATAAWPLDSSKRQTHVEITIEGSYDFLHDMFSNECTPQQRRWSQIRTNSVKKFLITLQRLCQTDKLLVHLQSFGTNPVHYKLTDGIKNGLSVFYIPPNSNNPVLNLPHNAKDTALNQFASFWKPVVNLDIKIWQKWMHCHRIGVVLQHDMPLPKYLHIPNSSGRYSMILCRQSATALHDLLQNWATFVLTDTTAYIKFLPDDSDKSPEYFLLLKLTSKPPCILIRTAFLGGTPGEVRHQVLKDLKRKVLTLKFAQRGGPQKVVKGSKTSKVEVKVRKPPLQRERSEISCCILLTKPVEHILISYERKPKDMTILEDPSRYIPSHVNQQQLATKSTFANAFNALSRYLHHQRWIWTVKQGQVDISMQAVGRILSTLTKIRLQEGFHFASSNAGIVNMVLEVDMMHKDVGSDCQDNVKSDVGLCVVQYIIFPPHVKTTRDSVSEEDMDELETTEADGELQIVTECWIEPQYGVAINNPPERQHWDGLNYKEIAKALYPKDLECTSCLVTFEHLLYVCQNNALFVDLQWHLDGSLCSDPESMCPYKDGEHKDKTTPPNIHQMAFPFDLLSLLPKCQQAELKFSSFILPSSNSDEIQRDIKGSNALLLQLLYKNLRESSEKEITLTQKESKNFLTLLKQRKRDEFENPFPFPIHEDTSDTTDGEEMGVDDIEKQQQTTPPQQKPGPTESPGEGAGNPEEKIKEKVAMWQCFVQSVSNSRVIFTLIPASFDDLLVLNNVDLEEKILKPSFIPQTSSLTDDIGIIDQDSFVRGLESDVTLDTEEQKPESESKDPGNLETSRNTTAYCKTSYTIPVYMYECYLYNVIDSLVNPWNFQLPADVFQDLTFDTTVEYDEIFALKSPLLKKISLDTSDIKDEKEDMNTTAQSMRLSMERRSTEGSETDLRQQCSNLCEIYYRCFVYGVFQSLQQGLYIDRQNIEAAINNICEETLPLEIDITTFLHASCRHFQDLVDSTKSVAREDKVEEAEETEVPKRTSVRFLDLDDSDGESISGNVPAVLQLPQGTVKLELPREEVCEHFEGLHNIIRNKFMDIIQKWFKVVPTYQDFYFYCPESLPLDSNTDESDDENNTELSESKQESYSHEDTFEDTTVFQEPEDDYSFMEKKTDFPDKKSNNPDLASIASQLDSQSSYVGSDYDLCDDLLTSGEKDSAPMFLHFTCTVKSRLQHENVSVQKLVPCLEEITSSIEHVLELHLEDLKVTFDLNCLTYPSDDDISGLKKPSFVRMLSGASGGLHSPPPTATDADKTEADTSVGPGPSSFTFGDHIGHLPCQQHEAVLKCKEELEWLLRDEIASSLLHLNPIKRDALQFVIEHIKQSTLAGKPACSCEKIPLHFVYGAEHSLAKFKEEFERQHLHGFRLIQEDNFYYAVRTKHMSAHVSTHAQALNDALEVLSRGATPSRDSVSSLNQRGDFSIMSSEAGELTTYVSPDFISQGIQRIRGRNASGSPDISGNEDSPHFIFFRESGHKQGRTLFEQRMARKSSGTSDSGSKEKTDDSRRGSKEYDHGQRGAGVTPQDLNLNTTTSITVSSDKKLKVNIDEKMPEKVLGKPPLQPSKSSEPRNQGTEEGMDDGSLKKSSSFAGFYNGVQPSDAVTQQESISDLFSTPLKQVKGMPQLPSLGRLRHSSAPSGQGTPRSKTSTVPQTPSLISSRGSFTDVGYDGDSSASEEGTTALSDMSGLHYPVPKFWLIMQVHKDAVEVYYHSRETGQEENNDLLEQRKLLSDVKKSIEDLCRRINQLLLLNDLYETRMCKNLLVPEADEDVSWNVDRTFMPGKPPSLQSDEDEEEALPEQQYLAAEYKLLPGYFECDCVMTHQFIVHPRLKTGTGRATVSRGVQTLRGVLNKFSVNNRKNMFVIKETGGAQNVFYIRLKEINVSALSRQVSSISTEDMGMCELFNVKTQLAGEVCKKLGLFLFDNYAYSFSSMMFAAKKEEQAHLTADKDLDTVSMTSAGSVSCRPLQDMIEIHVHGIQPAGSEIQNDLMNLLQNRLDDAVLEMISLQLIRNPMSKLAPEDVHFIQRPNEGTKMTLHQTIPSQLNMQLSALIYYLRQNLLQFSHNPNYSDSRPSNHFQDKVNDKWQAMSEDQVFLYIRPHSSGGKGIACVNVSLVDGMDNPVQMLCCQKPSRTGHTHVENVKDFHSFIRTESYIRSSRQRPGPTALVRFRIWERGSADLNTVKEKLICALKHALCDIVTEYYFLTASLCNIPHKLQELLPSPAISAPSSPANFRDHERRPTPLSRKNSIDSMKVFSTSKPTDKPITPSPLQIVKDAFSSRTRLMSPPPDSTKTFDIPATASQVASPCGSASPGQRVDPPQDIQQIIRLYEEGERGILHHVFTQKILNWFNYCHKLGVPSVCKTEQKFTSKYSLDYFMREFQSSANNICCDIHPKIFKLQHDPDGNLVNGTQYNPSRHQLQAGESKSETSLDFDRGHRSEKNENIDFTVIGRNVDQWQASIQDFSEEDMMDTSTKQSQKAVPKQSYQRFSPYLLEKCPDKDGDKVADPYSSLQKPATAFIPRQRLLILYLHNQNLIMYSYNWAGDLSTLLTKSVNRLVQWQNARICLLNSIISQKMGLFCHTPFLPCGRKKSQNPYTSTTTDLDLLIKQQAPPGDMQRRHNSMTTVFSSHRSCDEAYKDLQPANPLHQTLWAKYCDPVKKHGCQSQEIRLNYKRDVEKMHKLSKHFWMCMEKSVNFYQVSDEVIQLLKKSSRLLHYCATPLLFDPQWRLKVMEKYRVTRRQMSNTSERTESKIRSRHSSGTSTSSQRVRRADSQEGKKRPSITPTDSPVNDPRARFQREEPWHIDLRRSFENQYIQYVQSLGFVHLDVSHSTPKKSTHLKKSNEREEDGGHQSLSGITYLQKTLSGGIMLMELSFREQYFCVKLFVCENTRLGVVVNKQLKLLFVDECEKCKDLIHVHSFAHDFHLRCIQSCVQDHVSKTPGLFKANYHLTGFLSDFMQVYPYPPKFSRNFVYEDFLRIPELSSTGQHLFEFMLQHDKLYELKKFTMTPTVDPDIDGDYFFIKNNEFALIQHKDVIGQTPLAGSKQKREDHCVSLVITHDSQQVNFQSEAERNTLKLQYFIIITSKKEFFPKDPTEKRPGEFKALVLQELADRTKTIPVKQHISVRKESQKYHRIPNIHHTSPGYILLMQEANMAKQKMHKMVEISMAKCRNDSLWNRLLVCNKTDEDSKRKRRSETEESKDGFQKLSLEEFLELLKMAVKKSISDIDHQLTPFLNLHPQWYKGLHKKLQSKYPDTHRAFSSQDGNVQYIVILNGNFLDMFTMLMIDSKENRMEMCAVFRDAPQDQTDSPDNPSLPVRSVQSHVEDFVNVCCFQLWATML